MTPGLAKNLIKEYVCTKKSAIYFPNDEDFLIFNFTKLLRCTTKLIDILSYAEFKDLILKKHKKEKTINLFKEEYYYPDSQKLIQNIFIECEICNLAKTEHQDTKLTYETTPEVFNTREKYVIDFYLTGNQIFLSCIDIYSKIASLFEVKSRDWLEAKCAITKILNDMGKPQEIKADKDSAFICIALQNWFRSEGVKISVTTSKNGISDIERFHKTVNEKLRIIGSEKNIEDRCTKFETILYVYNHKTKHNSTKRFPAVIYLYAGSPDLNVQQNKIDKIEYLE